MSFLQSKKVTFDIGGGRMVTIETGKMARQADGAVVVRQGNCMLLATVVANKEPKEGQSFFPLSVDYQEKFSSNGRIPGSFFKREARLNDYEILTSRLIDRALRPLFPEDYVCDVQVLISLISSDDEVMPDSLACLAASAALAVSDIPIQEMLSEVRVAKVNGQIIINPTRTELATADYEFIIAATNNNIMMVEGEAKECSEEDLIIAIEAAHKAIQGHVKAQEELRALVGVTTKRAYTKPYRNEELDAKIIAFAKANNILVVHDNPYSFILNEKPTSILSVDGAKDVAIELNSLSKSQNMAGWRVGIMCGAKERIEEVLRFKSNMDSGMFLPVQLAAAKALSMGKYWYDGVNKIYADRKIKAFELLDLLNCTYKKTQAGMFVWAKIPLQFEDGYKLSDEVLYNANVFVTPGGIFGSNGNGYIRVSLCAPVEKFEEAIKRIKAKSSTE